MEIEEKGSINDLEQKFAFLGLYKYYQICCENSQFWELSSMEAVLQAENSNKRIG